MGVQSSARGAIALGSLLTQRRAELEQVNAELDIILERQRREAAPGKGKDEDKDEDAPQQTDEGQKAIATLEREIALRGQLSREKRMQFEVESGNLRSITEAERARILELARQIDVAKAVIEADMEAMAAAEGLAKERAASHREAIREIEHAGLALLEPFEVARLELDRWVEKTRNALQQAGLRYEEYSAWLEAIAAERHQRIEQAELEHQERLAEQRLRESKHWRDGLNRGLQDISESAEDMASLIEGATYRAFDSMEDALVDFVRAGKLNFSSLADSIIADLARIAIRQSITGPLFGWLSGLGAGGGGVLYPAGTTAALSHAGGIAGGGLSRLTRTVPREIFAGAPRLHAGGIIGPDEVPTILQRGEGVFTAPQMAALGRSAAPPEVNIEFVNRGTPQRQIGDATTRWDGRRWVVGIVLDDLSRGGPIRRAIRGAGA